MTPRLNISFPLARQKQYWCGEEYIPAEGEYLLNHARTGIVMVLRVSLPNGGRVGVVAYNCHTVANSVVNAHCTPVFVDVTERLLIDVAKLPADLDAIVVSNLFGIRNDIEAIRAKCPKAIIIVDNAHGYGLPAEGDFTVYSINQGKFPALGEGGILKVAPSMEGSSLQIHDLYVDLSSYGYGAQIKLFMQMQLKALLYSPCLYWLVRKIKKNIVVNPKQDIEMRRMAPGISRVYNAALPAIEKQIEAQRENAKHIAGMLQTNGNVEDVFYGENAFMAIARCKKPQLLQDEFARMGIETETHFKHAIDWAEIFGYKRGTCPTTEKFTNELLMIPTYKKI